MANGGTEWSIAKAINLPKGIAVDIATIYPSVFLYPGMIVLNAWVWYSLFIAAGSISHAES